MDSSTLSLQVQENVALLRANLPEQPCSWFHLVSRRVLLQTVINIRITSIAGHTGNNEQCLSSAPAAQSAERKRSALELGKVINKRRGGVGALQVLHPGNWLLGQERPFQPSTNAQRGLSRLKSDLPSGRG